MPDHFEMSTTIPALPEKVFSAWLDGGKVTDFTGSPAEGDDKPGSSFDAWDGYITGTNLEVEPPRRVLQSWRTTEFPENAPDSTLEITFEPDGDRTLLRLRHSGIPDRQGDEYRDGWEEYYFAPLREYFSR
jgi:uncharacterized protein YndB with AHSA1/START domain